MLKNVAVIILHALISYILHDGSVQFIFCFHSCIKIWEEDPFEGAELQVRCDQPTVNRTKVLYKSDRFKVRFLYYVLKGFG